MCNCLCSVIVLCGMMMMMMMIGREKVKLGAPAHSLLFSKSTKGGRPHPTDESLSTVLYAFSTYILRKGSEFNPGL